MGKKESNIIRIGLIDMLSAFLVSSVVLMLIIAFSKPEAANIAGYPRNFVRLEFMVIQDAANQNDLRFRKGAKFKFVVETPEGTIQNEIKEGRIVRDDDFNFSMVNIRSKSKNDLQMWGPIFKKDKSSGSIRRDTMYYVMYGVSRSEQIKDWEFTATYFDNDLISQIGYNVNEKADKIIDQKIRVKVRWDYLGGSYVSPDNTLQLGDNKMFKVQ